MDLSSSASVSKGIFVYKNYKQCLQSKKKTDSFLDTKFLEQSKYNSFKKMWTSISSDINTLRTNEYSKIIEDLVDYINEDKCDYTILPTAALLTGINQSDHVQQFEIIANVMTNKYGCKNFVIILESQECTTIKLAIENLVLAIMKCSLDSDDVFNEFKKSQFTLDTLKSWFTECQLSGENYKKNIVIILPDVELFNVNVLEHLICLLSLASLPIILVLGISTTISSFFNNIPQNVTTKLKLKLFDYGTTSKHLEQILENIILTPKYQFQLSGNVFKLLTDIFLFYDLSLSGFIQGLKYCIMEHYKDDNCMPICTMGAEHLQRCIQELTHTDIERIRGMLPFRSFIESLKSAAEIIDWLTDDTFFRKSLYKLIDNINGYLFNFHSFMRILLVMVDDLPKAPLGKQLRDIYSYCQHSSMKVIQTDEFNECWQLLAMLSKDELLEKLKKCLKCIDNYKNEFEAANESINESTDRFKRTCNDYIRILTKTTTTKNVVLEVEQNDSVNPDEFNKLWKINNRQQFKDKLLQLSKESSKQRNEYQEIIDEFLNCLKMEYIDQFVIPIKYGPPLLELFVYSNVTSVKRHIMGSPRGTIDTALNNPQLYLRCKCCTLEDTTQLLPTLPDLSVAYKLHLESGRMINLFDWLKAFRTVVGVDDDNPDNIDSSIQARFTRAVAELEFLGFIKASTTKTDHVSRLTW